MYWPVMRLVLAGHDYAQIREHWTLPMVLKINRAMDLQARVDQKAKQAEIEKAKRKEREHGRIR